MTRLFPYAVAVLLAMTAQPATAIQETRPTCRLMCSIRVSEAAALGDADGAVIGYNHVAVKGGERILVSTSPEAWTVLEFTSDGDFVRSWGRPGQGPAEIGFVRSLHVEANGDVVVFDPGNRAAKRFSPEGEFISSEPFNASIDRNGALVLSDGSAVIAGLVPTSDQVGLRLHRWRDGEFLWSAVHSTGPVRGRVPSTAIHVSGDTLWTADKRGRMRFQARSLATGELLRTIEIQRDWFDDFQEAVGAPGNDDPMMGVFRPVATIEDIYVSGRRLLVLGTAPGRDWTKANERGFRDLGVLTDNYIEVIDLDTNELIVSERINEDDTLLYRFLDEGQVIGHRTGEVIDQAVVFDVRLPGRTR